ncbi:MULTISPECIES: hypothetical protein [unclassified Paenibacillus]|uniref:hypothetical protein n=1 Tax=unclassified Paenibacillus TaxID=185978 RepID=UPI0011B04054|nr:MULTISPECIES: hypothetical protein [unclassified Paenibacillus]QZN75063.1 hypothetical protein K5K90_27380 [Paenibacillus sp. DR312]
MAENILLGALRRYEFYSYSSNLIAELYKTVSQDLYGDIHWNWTYEPSNEYSIPRSWTHPSRSDANLGTLTAQNIKDPSMFFTISMNVSRFYTPNYSRDCTRSYMLRTGLRNNGSIVKPDLYTNVGAVTEIPLNTCINEAYSNLSNAPNVYWKWTLFTNFNYIYLFGEAQNYIGDAAYPVRLYLGRMKSFEEEDPLVANDFVGIFGHYPVGMNIAGVELKHNTGRGYVRTSRNGTSNALYHFSTSSQVPSPGLGGRYFISPFYVWHGTEGVRGEFFGIRTAVLRNSSMYPDGSILDLGDERYYVFHVNVQQHPATHQGFFATNGAYYNGQPYFFDSPLLLGGGQRVLLFEIEKEV